MFRGATQCLSSFSTSQIWGIPCEVARKVCPSVWIRIRTWFPLVRRVLAPVIGSQLLSDCISGTRLDVRGAMQISSSYFVTQGRSRLAHATNIGLSQCTDKNMIPTCAQSSVFCYWLTIKIWLYFSYTMFRGATQCLSNFFRLVRVAHARKVCPIVRLGTWFPLEHRVLPPVIGSQLISDYISATRCSMVPKNASLVFPPLRLS